MKHAYRVAPINHLGDIGLVDPDLLDQLVDTLPDPPSPIPRNDEFFRLMRAQRPEIPCEHLKQIVGIS